MKKLFISVFAFFVIGSVFADEFKITREIPENFTGTYVSVLFDNILRNTHSYEEAMSKSHSAGNYDILMLNNEICYSDLWFHDGYAIDAKEIEKWNFFKKDNDYFLTDEKGSDYIKIGNESDHKGYEAFNRYVLPVIFEDFLQNSEIKIQNDRITIYDKEFRWFKDSSYCHGTNCSIWLYGDMGLCVLKIEGIAARIYKEKPTEYRMWYEDSDDLLLEIPLFYWNDKNYPNIDVSNLNKKDLRIVRNLVYAKHGYAFKSDDLKNIFEDFNWYKINPNFKNSDLSAEEINLVDKILVLEQK